MLQRLRVLALLLTLVGCSLLKPAANAQSSPQTASDQAPSREDSIAAPEKRPSDENAEFKHSWSVEKLAKVTHLSADHAFWLAIILNFAVAVSLIPLVVRLIIGSNLRTAFRNRTASIQKSIEEARRASEDANQRLTQIESRLSRLGDEIAQMRATSEKEAAAEEERIKAAAEEDARRIVESAEQEIAAATKTARRELTAYAADLAVTLATKQIHVDAPTDQALVKNFANQLSNGGRGKA